MPQRWQVTLVFKGRLRQFSRSQSPLKTDRLTVIQGTAKAQPRASQGRAKAELRRRRTGDRGARDDRRPPPRAATARPRAVRTAARAPGTAPGGPLRAPKGPFEPPLLLSHGPSKGASAQLRGPSGSLSSASAKASETGSRPSNPIFQHRNDSQQHEDACFSPLQTWPAAKATTGPNPCASI